MVRLVLAGAWQARWRSLLVLALTVGLAGGAALAGIAGARRSSTALDRFEAAARTLDVFIAADVTTPEPPGLLEVLEGPLVESTNDLVFVFVDVDRVGFVFAPTSRRGLEIEQGVLLEGRRADPEEPDEVVVSSGSARTLGLAVGDVLETATLTPEQAVAVFETGEVPVPGGPRLRLEVVGIVRNGFDLVSGDRQTQLTMPTPAFFETYGDQIGIGSRSHWVRLVDRPGAVDEFTDAVAAAYGGEHLPSINVGQGEDAVADAISVVTAALLLGAVVIGIGGMASSAAAMLREQRLLAEELATLRALGWTHEQRRSALVGVVVPGLVAGAVLAPVVAVVASRWFPVGTARRFDPAPGAHVDAVVLGAGTLVLFAALVLVAAAIAGRLARSTVRVLNPRPVARSLETATAVLPPPAGVGVRFALRAASRGSAIVRSTLVGSVIGVVGVVAVALVGASVDRLVDTPARWGTPWDVAIDARGFDGGPFDLGGEDGEVVWDEEALLDEPDIAAAAMVLYDEQVTVNGVEAISMTVEPLKADLTPTVVQGREPRADDEVALARDTLRAADAAVGATVQIGARSQRSETYRVVGVVAFPSMTEPGSLAVGSTFTEEGGDRLQLGDPTLGDDVGTPFLVLRWAPGVDVPSALARLGQDGDAEGFESPLVLPAPPTEVAGLDEAEVFPLIAGAGLAVLGLLAVAHGLFVSVGRHRHDLGVLGALGFTPAQRRAVVRAQAATVALVALAAGLPLGVMAGRQVWIAIARTLGVATDPVLPWGLLAGGAAGLLALLLLLALWPGHTAHRLDLADALRAE